MKNAAAILVLATIVFVANLFKTEQEIEPEKLLISQDGQIMLLMNQRRLLIQQVEYKNAQNKIEITKLKNKK